MRVKMGEHIYRPRLEILGETGLIPRKGRSNSYYSEIFECDLDGFVGTRKRMIWHIKSKHKEFLEMVE